MLKNLLSRTSTSVIVEPENCYKNINEQNKAVSSLSVLDYNINSTVMNSTENIVLVNLENEINVYDDEKTTDEHEPNFNGIQSQIENYNEADIETPVENIDKNETTKKVCPVCRKAFTSQTWFSKHMQKEHSEEKFCCTQCPKSKYTDIQKLLMYNLLFVIITNKYISFAIDFIYTMTISSHNGMKKAYPR